MISKAQLGRDERAVLTVLSHCKKPMSAQEIFLRGGELVDALRSLLRKGEIGVQDGLYAKV